MHLLRRLRLGRRRLRLRLSLRRLLRLRFCLRLGLRLGLGLGLLPGAAHRLGGEVSLLLLGTSLLFLERLWRGRCAHR